MLWQELVSCEERPRLRLPIWRVAGHMPGMANALLRPEAVMASAEAVEDLIDGRRFRQEQALAESDPDYRREFGSSALASLNTGTPYAASAASAPGHGVTRGTWFER